MKTKMAFIMFHNYREMDWWLNLFCSTILTLLITATDILLLMTDTKIEERWESTNGDTYYRGNCNNWEHFFPIYFMTEIKTNLEFQFLYSLAKKKISRILFCSLLKNSIKGHIYIFLPCLINKEEWNVLPPPPPQGHTIHLCKGAVVPHQLIFS